MDAKSIVSPLIAQLKNICYLFIFTCELSYLLLSRKPFGMSTFIHFRPSPVAPSD